MKQTIATLLNTAPHLLIVDDDMSQLEQMVDWLADRPGKIFQARSSEQAQTILNKHPITAVITDWQLPEMSGLDLIRYLRQQQFNGPLLLCTGLMLTPEHLQMAFAAGANDYLRKPLNGVELNARLDNALALHANTQALRLLSQSQEHFIQFLSTDLGGDLHMLNQIQRLGSNPERERELTRDLTQKFQALMEWARYRLQLQWVQPYSFELKDLIKGLENHFQNAWHRVHLRGVKGVNLYTDPDILQRVFIQLLENALTYSEQGVSLQISPKESEVIIAVKSMSPEMSAGRLQALLEVENQGLGLMMTQDLLTLLKSKLCSRLSRKGETVFYFALRHH